MFDVAVVGGGIVGLAAARELLQRHPRAKLVLLEKEACLAHHQTGHNSGVIHSGIYYRPGSLKARTCVAGAKLLVAFCRERGIRHEICGKVIVATDEAEVPRLRTLHERAVANGVERVELIGRERLRELEPHARGVMALHVPTTGIVDYKAVARAYAQDIHAAGGEIRPATLVRRIHRRGGAWIVETSNGDVQASYLVTCAGLQADRIARMGGAPNDVQIIPFRGEYYELTPARHSLVRNLIYPVPDPALPFLGVHLTRMIDGQIHVGPNAVLALKREGYRKFDANIGDILDLLRYRGFWRMAKRYWAYGIGEWYRSLSRAAFVRSVQRLLPEVRDRDLVPSGSGVRAQAVDVQGALVDDFNIVQADCAIHVRNVPSPAATASMRVGQAIADMAESAFSL